VLKAHDLYRPPDKERCVTIYLTTIKLDFVHLLDKTRTAGYAKFRPNCQEGMNHAQPASGDYTRAAPL
jgi:hypothetical protein